MIMATVVYILNAIFGIFGTVTTLPTIGGYDIDAALVTGMGSFYAFTNAMWPVTDVMGGVAVLYTYYFVKMVARFLLGHRAPGSTT